MASERLLPQNRKSLYQLSFFLTRVVLITCSYLQSLLGGLWDMCVAYLLQNSSLSRREFEFLSHYHSAAY